MSTCVRKSGAVEVTERRAPARVVFTWELPEGAGGLSGGAVTLEISVEGERFDAWLVRGGERVDMARAVAGVVERDEQRGMWHAGAAGVLFATWRERGREPVYARTPLLERLGLVGGTYELRGMRAE